jgi:uncharacterized protein (DUF1697 family)
MADLRALAEKVGFKAPRTYIQSGNLVFEASGASSTVEGKLEAALEARFGFPVAVVARTAEAWASVAATNPWKALSATEGNRVMVAFSRAPPKADAATGLLERAVGGEQVQVTPGAVWLHFPEGIGVSKLTPAALDRAIGSKVTVRNWRTVVALAEMSGVA